MNAMLVACVLVFSPTDGVDKRDCKCGICECADGRVARDCLCKGCRCADVSTPPQLAMFVAELGFHAGVTHLWNTPLEGSKRGVVFSDAFKFGVNGPMSRQIWMLSSQHHTVMRSAMLQNSQAVIDQWERECNLRSSAWSLLDDVLYCQATWYDGNCLHYRLDKLNQLRLMIGDKAFYAGEMPDPTPHYKFAEK